MSDTSLRRKRGLGMGLSALLGEEDVPVATARAEPATGFGTMPVELLHPSPLQPRRRFADVEIEALAASLREKGVLQPLIVRASASASGGYEIVAGERRWRAAQIAGLHELPVVIREIDDRGVLEVALVENLQREDLNALEEAQAYRKLIDELGHSQEDVAQAVGKSRSHVANTLRLLALPEEVRGHVEEGALSAGHARALLSARNAVVLADYVIDRQLNVRETEALARHQAAEPRVRTPQPPRDPNIREAEESLSYSLGMPVAIKTKRKGGTLEIRFSNLDQLEGLMALLRG